MFDATPVKEAYISQLKHKDICQPPASLWRLQPANFTLKMIFMNIFFSF